MNARPKPTDTEDDVLEMQKKFIAEKNKNTKFTASAQVVRVEKPKKQSIYAQRKLNENKPSTSAPSPAPANVLLGEIIERPFPTTQRTNSQMEVEPAPSTGSFPKVEKITVTESTGGKSLFALSMERKRAGAESGAIAKEQPSIKTLKENYGKTSALVQEQDAAKAIHEENLNIIAQMKQDEILAERENLLKSIDPNLLRFIEEKRKQKIESVSKVSSKKQTSSQVQNKLPESKVPPIIDPKPIPIKPAESMDTSNNDVSEKLQVDTVVEILKVGEAEKWLHFDIIEKEKFEWMKDVPSQIAKLKPGETFEARFDWKGVLLPYVEQQNEKDDRELYLHGDEPHRPGYTLQELFRLCRSNVMQQRCSAFGAISGILNIYNQGFYDSVLDLPITKIFFLLRFGFDENSPAILEVVSRSLAMLFYNETDEALLDLITETSEGYLQPMLNVVDYKPSENIENVFSKMRLTSTPFSTKIEDDEDESKTSMNDFHLAETDLIECLLRTNIIQRVYYILGIVRPENSTVHSCLKLLIRIARTSRDACNQIAMNDELLKVLFANFLPRFESISCETDNEFYNFPQHLVMKLFRIMVSHHKSFCIKLMSHDLLDRIKSYLFTRQDIKSKLIKVQIETLRILRSMMLMNMDGTIYRDLLPAFRYMLEWHYQHVELGEGGAFLIRQHASALLNAIHSGTTVESIRILGEMLAMCSCKWFHEATKHGVKEFSQSTILASTLNCVTKFIVVDKAYYLDFINKYFRQFIQSKSLMECITNLRFVSILLKKSNDRRNLHPPLFNAGTVLLINDSPQLIISQNYPIFLLNSIFYIIEILQSIGENLISDFIKSNDLIECFTNFIERTSKYINKNLATSFVAKAEIRFLFKILCFKPIYAVMPYEVVLRAAYNLVCCMTTEHILEIETLFRNIIFNGEKLKFDILTLSQWKAVFLQTFVYPHRVFIPATEISLSMPCSQATLLSLDWPYALLKTLLNKYLQQISDTIEPDLTDISESEIIKLTLEFTELLESNGLVVTSPTEKLMYIMISFMGPKSEFLEPNMKEFLSQHTKKFFNRSKNVTFKFDAIFENKCKFENLYVLFLDQFQAASYGDATFSALVLVPLAQKYDNKWRKMVWSEHASVLRFLNCDESELLGSIEDYLTPIETEESLVKSYMQALRSNLLRKNTIAYKIAHHHAKNFVPKSKT